VSKKLPLIVLGAALGAAAIALVAAPFSPLRRRLPGGIRLRMHDRSAPPKPAAKKAARKKPARKAPKA